MTDDLNREPFAKPAAVYFKSLGDRGLQCLAFLKTHDWQDGIVMPLKDDASARKYYRLEHKGFSVLLMDFPPDAISIDPHGIYENPQRLASILPVIETTRLFAKVGWHVPEILAHDEKMGLALIADFGDQTFTRLLAENVQRQPLLYVQAVDEIIHLHRYYDHHEVPSADLVRYEPGNFKRMLESFKKDYLPLIVDDPQKRDQAMAAFDAMLDDVLPLCWTVGETVIHRDFHVDNLMLVENDDGGEDCAIIDFQDAAIAARPYDLVSLLRDVRHDIGSDLEQSLKMRYLAAFPDLDQGDFETAYLACNTVRILRILGRFGWLAIHEGKRRYLDFIPNCWSLLLRDADMHLPALSDWVKNHIPPNIRMATHDRFHQNSMEGGQ